ncbi:MAG: S1 family peptidase [Sorangiineae bacterium]|nr:S1 family peptidase [Polyangiaceae bacterium]MEB2324129.1 S1 family peptidase [Sorangiineae bacterium]
MRHPSLLVTSLVLLPLLSACSSASDPGPSVLARSMARISGGAVDNTHTAVVGIFMQNGHMGGMCTGSLIAPNLVLTARHCVASLPSESVMCGSTTFGDTFPASSFYVTTNTTFSYDQSAYVGSSEVRVPSEGSDACGFDVALIILSKPIPASQATPYVPRVDQEVVVGEPYTAIGFGQTSDGSQNSGGTRMQRGGLRVSWHAGESLPEVCGSTMCGYGLASSEWQGETGVCSGDSGGPAIDAENRVIGVVSRGSQGCQTPIYGGVAPWKDFIMQGALDAAEAGGYEPPSWALTGSTEGSGGAGGASGGAGGASGGAGGGSDAQGQSCSAGAPCPTGYACVYDSDPSHAYCAAACASNSDCEDGLACNPALHACMSPPAASEPASAESASGCAFVRDRGPARPVPWLIGAGLALVASLRRRR